MWIPSGLSTDPTYKKINIQRGQTGFVRFRRPDGNEIYTVHGQNVFVLLNSHTIHGYAFDLPFAPNNPILDPGVTVPRPATTVDAVLKNSSGTIKDSGPVISSCSGTGCYRATFSSMVFGGDIVEVTINQNLIKACGDHCRLRHLSIWPATRSSAGSGQYSDGGWSRPGQRVHYQLLLCQFSGKTGYYQRFRRRLPPGPLDVEPVIIPGS